VAIVGKDSSAFAGDRQRQRRRLVSAYFLPPWLDLIGMYPESVASGIPVLHSYLNEAQRTNPNTEGKKLPNNGALTLPLAPDVACRELEVHLAAPMWPG